MTNAGAPSIGGFWKPFTVVTCFTPFFVAIGSIYGQSAGMLPQLLDENSFIRITMEEATWIASIPPIGTCIACLVSGPLSDRFGRIKMCQIACLLVSIGYAVMVAASGFILLVLGRFLTGLGMGWGFSISVHVSEVAPPAYRGIFLSIYPLLSSAGIVYIYIVGGYLPWNIAAAATCLIAILGLVLVMFCYESPVWLLRKNRIDATRKSLKRLVSSAEVDAKLKELQNVADFQPESKFSCTTFVEPAVWKPFLMLLVMSVLQNTAGFYIVVSYTVQFMREFHTTYDPLQCMVAVGVARLLAMGLTSYLLRRMGRKTAGALSGFSSATMLTLIYAYLNFEKRVSYLQENSWIPIGLFLAYIVTMTLGIYTLPWMLPYEVFPIKVRGVMCGASIFSMYVVMFFSVKMYDILMDNLRLKGMVLMFAASSGLFGLFSVTMLVETHKKTLDEVEAIFAGKIRRKESLKA